MTKFDGCMMQMNPSEKNLRKVLTNQKDFWSMYLNHWLWKGNGLKFFKLLPIKKIYVYKEVLLQKFDDDILSLWLRNKTKTKYPKCYEFYSKNCVSRTYHFYIFKCSVADCPWHEPIRFGKVTNFEDLVPSEIADGAVKYILGLDRSEKVLPPKLENPGKCTHGIPFTSTVKTTITVNKIVKCIHCLKPRVVCSKKKLFDACKWSMKPMLNDFQYVCGSFPWPPWWWEK